MAQDPVAGQPLATFEVETVAMADGRTIRFYTWPPAPDEVAHPTEADRPTEPAQARAERPDDV